MTVCVYSACLSVREHNIWNHAYNADRIFVHVTKCRGSVLCHGGVAINKMLPVLWTASYLHVMGHTEACRYRRRDAAAARRVQANALVASYWLCPLVDGVRRDESFVQGVPGAESAMDYCRFVTEETAVLRRC